MSLKWTYTNDGGEVDVVKSYNIEKHADGRVISIKSLGELDEQEEKMVYEQTKKKGYSEAQALLKASLSYFLRRKEETRW